MNEIRLISLICYCWSLFDVIWISQSSFQSSSFVDWGLHCVSIGYYWYYLPFIQLFLSQTTLGLSNLSKAHILINLSGFSVTHLFKHHYKYYWANKYLLLQLADNWTHLSFKSKLLLLQIILHVLKGTFQLRVY